MGRGSRQALYSLIAIGLSNYSTGDLLESRDNSSDSDDSDNSDSDDGSETESEFDVGRHRRSRKWTIPSIVGKVRVCLFVK
jgi:hypothetical protein